MDPTDAPDPRRLNRDRENDEERRADEARREEERIAAARQLRLDALPDVTGAPAIEAEPLTGGEGLRDTHDAPIPRGTPKAPARRASATLAMPAVWLGVLLGVLASTLLFLGALVLLALL